MEGPFHIGTGMSRPGYADAIVRRDKVGKSLVTPGDAVKGAIRQSAEQLLRWLAPRMIVDSDVRDAFPTHPVIRRIFAPLDTGPFYRFSVMREAADTREMRVASTAIDPKTGVALDGTLRIFEYGIREARFKISVLGQGGGWNNQDSTDYLDMMFLAAAVLCTEGIGGRKGTGAGRIRASDFECQVEDSVSIPPPWSSDLIQKLKKHVAEAP